MPSFEFSLGQFLPVLGNDKFLVFRENGSRCYSIIEEALRQVPIGRALLITIPASIVMDYSFADETIGNLFSNLVAGKLGERYAVIKVSNTNQFENVEASFVVRKQFGMVVFPDESWRLVGQRPKGDRARDEQEETLAYLVTHNHLSANELADLTGMTITASNNRLFRLFEDGLTHRLRDGTSREYIYFSLLSPEVI